MHVHRHAPLIIGHRAGMALAVLAGILGSSDGHAQLSYTGGLAQQDFNTLPMSGTFDYQDAAIAKGPAALAGAPVSAPGAAGWSIYARVGTQLLFNIDNGSSTTATVYSHGPLATSERALGSLGGAHVANLGWRLINDTGQTLTEFTLGYRGEQWRNGGNGGGANLNRLEFGYRITATPGGDIDTGTYALVSALDFTALQTSPGGFALNGNASTNRVERSATVTGLNWQPGEILILRWRDFDETGSDDGLAIDDVLFFAPTSPGAPQVAACSPALGASHVLPTTPIVVTFDQPVTVPQDGTWVQIQGSSSGVAPASISGGPLRFTMTPAAPFGNGETVTVTLLGSLVAGASSQPMAADFVSSFSTLPATATILPIHLVQGTEGYSPLAGATVTVRGVVVADFQGASPALGGFFLQEEEGDADADSSTSEALWIADQGSAAAVEVSVGDVVQVTGTVSESGGLTQLVGPTAIAPMGTAALPTGASVSLPVASGVFLERYEGMRVQFAQTLTVTGNSGTGGITDNYARFGELMLCSDGPLVVPTEFIDPNDSPAAGTTSSGRTNVPAVHAHESLSALRSIVLDDASLEEYPDPTPFFNAQGTRRCGDTVAGLSGVLSFASGRYRVQPTGPVSFVDANPRPAAPPIVTGRIRVAAMNVLNFFTTFGGAGDRGASNATEFQRQKDKIVAALAALDADVLGLIEIQNTSAAVNDLLGALNAAVGANGYLAGPEPAGGASGDAIRTVWFYRPSTVVPFGPCYADYDAVWNTPNPLRYPLAQAFAEIATGERFIACLNHWKSKSSSGASGANRDQNDGQAAFNDLRRQQAARLHSWLQSVRASVGDEDVLVLGDLNSHGEEDPLDILRAAGDADQGARFQPDDYSYRNADARGRLDHAFATGTMAAQVVAAAHWHINADEPPFYDYNTENKSAAQQAVNVGTPFRSSDHDPVLIGVDLAPQPTTFAMWVASIVWPGGADTQATGDPDGDGATNLEEFVCNTDPLVAHGALRVAAARSGTDFILQFRMRETASGVTIIPEWSDNLLNWHPMGAPGLVSALDSITGLYQAAHPYGNSARLFGRLRITLP